MANEQQKNQKPLSASERINRLEGALMNAYQTMDNMARDLMLTKDALRLVGSKLEAVVKVVNSGEKLTNENIIQEMINNNIADLADKVELLVKNGVLAKSESIGEHAFLVAREIDADGKVVNPRIQFNVSSQPKEIQDKLLGAKAGDLVTLTEGKAKLEVLETYEIQMPKEEAPKTEANA